MGCHFLLQCMKVKSESEDAQLCPTLSDPMDCSLPGSSVHGIFQARVLEWVAIAFSQKSHVFLKSALRYPGENTGPSIVVVVFLTSATSITSTPAHSCSLSKYLLRVYLCQLDIITGSEDVARDTDSCPGPLRAGSDPREA